MIDVPSHSLVSPCRRSKQWKAMMPRNVPRIEAAAAVVAVVVVVVVGKPVNTFELAKGMKADSRLKWSVTMPKACGKSFDFPIWLGWKSRKICWNHLHKAVKIECLRFIWPLRTTETLGAKMLNLLLNIKFFTVVLYNPTLIIFLRKKHLVTMVVSKKNRRNPVALSTLVGWSMLPLTLARRSEGVDKLGQGWYTYTGIYLVLVDNKIRFF